MARQKMEPRPTPGQLLREKKLTNETPKKQPFRLNNFSSILAYVEKNNWFRKSRRYSSVQHKKIL